MAVIYDNLDKMMAGVHGPKADGVPLYIRVDNKSVMDGWNETAAYRDIAIGTYNSPTNIRRVAIGHKNIKVWYFIPWQNPSDSGKRFRANKTAEDGYMVRAAQSILKIGAEVETHKFSGTGLTTLFTPWVASNIEEIYFDWSILCSPKVRERIVNATMLLTMSLESKDKREEVYQLKPDMAKSILMAALRDSIGTEEEVLAKFKRLTTVGFIGNLERLNLGMAENNDSGMLSNVRDSATPLIVNTADQLRTVGGAMSIWYTDRVKKLNPDFSIRSGIYRLDDEKLSYYFNEYSSAIDKFVADRKKQTDDLSKAAEEELKKRKSNLEKHLDSIEEQIGTNGLKDVWRLSAFSSESKEIEAALAEMSEDGRKKYKSILSIEEA